MLDVAQEADVDSLFSLVSLLEQLAAPLAPALQGLAEGLGPRGTADTDALLAHGRSCAVTILSRGTPTELREAAIGLDEALAGRARGASPAVQARADEWARMFGGSAARRGPAQAAQVLQARNGKPRAVALALASQPAEMTRAALKAAVEASGLVIGDDSGFSHVLRDLADADVIERWRAGRETMVALTATGRETMRSLGMLEEGAVPQSHKPGRAHGECVVRDEVRHAGVRRWKERYERAGSDVPLSSVKRLAAA